MWELLVISLEIMRFSDLSKVAKARSVDHRSSPWWCKKTQSFVLRVRAVSLAFGGMSHPLLPLLPGMRHIYLIWIFIHRDWKLGKGIFSIRVHTGCELMSQFVPEGNDYNWWKDVTAWRNFEILTQLPPPNSLGGHKYPPIWTLWPQ